MVELVGPSRFSRFEAGQPLGESHPQAWVQVAAVNQSQTRNTMTLFPSLISPEAILHFGLEIGAELIKAHGGRQRLEAVTSSYRALEGGRSTFVILNETHHWIRGNNGDRMAETIDGNATKKDSRYLAITNAYLPGENSVAEKMREAYEKIREGRAVDIGMMYDSLEARPEALLTPEEALKVVIRVRGDAIWLRPETIVQSILDSTIAPSRSRRMFYNQIVAEEDAVYGPKEWDGIRDDSLVLLPADEIVMGFDGGKTDDSTALVALRVRDQAAFLLGIWEKPDGPAGQGWQINSDLVDGAVRDAFRTYRVQGFYADVALWESYISEWTALFGEGLAIKAGEKSPIGWDMRSSIQRSVRAHERLMDSVFTGKLTHNGDLTLRRHALNARRRTNNNYGISFGKESKDSPRKVDAYAALMLAHEALNDLRTRGKKTKARSGRGYFM